MAFWIWFEKIAKFCDKKKNAKMGCVSLNFCFSFPGAGANTPEDNFKCQKEFTDSKVMEGKPMTGYVHQLLFASFMTFAIGRSLLGVPKAKV